MATKPIELALQPFGLNFPLEGSNFDQCQFVSPINLLRWISIDTCVYRKVLLEGIVVAT
jgi:hypothetical protein